MKKIKKIITVLLMFILTVCVTPVTAHADSKKVLQSGITYRQYDFNGDGKNDTFKYVLTRENGVAYAKIYLNGCCRGKMDMMRGGSLTRVATSKKDIFLIALKGGYSGNALTAYKISGNRIIHARDLTHFTYNQLYKVSNNKLYIKCSTGKEFGGTFNCRYSRGASFIFTHSVKNRSISSVNVGYPTGTKVYTAGTSFRTSTSTSYMNGKGFYVYRGQKVTLKKIYCKSDGTWFQISANGRTGWIKNSSSYLLK